MKTGECSCCLHNRANMVFGVIIMVVLASCLTKQTQVNAQKNSTERIDAFIWELKPYVFTRDGQIRGMIHSYFDEILKTAKCRDYQQVSEVIHVKHIYRDIKEFRKALLDIQNDVKRPEFENSSQLTYWYPLLENSELYGEKLNMIVGLHGESVAILTRQRNVDIGSKFFKSLSDITPFLLITAIISTMFSVLIWIIVSSTNTVF